MCMEKYVDLNSHLVLLAAKVGIILQTAAKIVNYFFTYYNYSTFIQITDKQIIIYTCIFIYIS